MADSNWRGFDPYSSGRTTLSDADCMNTRGFIQSVTHPKLDSFTLQNWAMI